MYGDQFGEIECGYWGLKGYNTCRLLFIITTRKSVNSRQFHP